MEGLNEFMKKELHITESQINESSEPCTEEMLDQVRDKLPELEDLIRTALGCSRNEKIGLHVELDRKGRIDLTSDDLLHMLGSTLVHTIFKEINLDSWGGNYIPKENKIWFNPQLHYQHPGGGTNGIDFIWSSLYFNLETQEWEPDRKIF